MSILDDILIKHLGLLPDLTTAWCCLSKSPSKRSHCTTIVIRLERFHQSLFSIFFLGLLIPLDWSSSWQFFLRKFKVFNIHGSRQFTLFIRSEFFKQYDSNQVKTAAFFRPEFCGHPKKSYLKLAKLFSFTCKTFFSHVSH